MLKVMRPPKHNPTKPHCFLTQRASNTEASRTNVSEETPCTWLARAAPSPQGSLVRDFIFILLGKSVKNTFLFSMTA
jgi:hypothetical protein